MTKKNFVPKKKFWSEKKVGPKRNIGSKNIWSEAATMYKLKGQSSNMRTGPSSWSV